MAEHAVACILALGPAQHCDGSRVNLCGHLALMNACTAAEQASASSPGGDDLSAHCSDKGLLGCEAVGEAH